MTDVHQTRNRFALRNIVWLGCTVLALGACSRPCGRTGDPEIWLGTGERSWEDLPDDGRLELIHGPQGGYHVLVSLRAAGLAADGVLVAEMTGTIDGEVIGSGSPWLQLECLDDGSARESLGLFLIYDAQPEDLHDQPSQVSVSVEDLAGRLVSAEMDILIWDPSLE